MSRRRWRASGCSPLLEKEIVWEYMNPYCAVDPNRTNRIFRAHRVPHDWVPQLDRPTESAVIPLPNEAFRITPPG